MYVYVCVLEFFSSGSTILPEWRETVLLQNLDLEELLPQQSVEWQLDNHKTVRRTHSHNILVILNFHFLSDVYARQHAVLISADDHLAAPN